MLIRIVSVIKVSHTIHYSCTIATFPVSSIEPSRFLKGKCWMATIMTILNKKEINNK